MFKFFAFLIAISGVLSCASIAGAEGLDNQRRVFVSESPSSDYRFTLGTLKNINARVVAEREVVLSGELERVTYEFIDNLSYSEAWQILASRYGPSVGRELFSCSGLDCGRSNDWANNRLGIKQLYGLDQTQKYRALVLNDSPNTYVSVYFVQRGNRRIYAQVDTISVAGQAKRISASPSTISSALEIDGVYSMPVIDGAQNTRFDADEVSSLVEALRRKPFSKYYVVGHYYVAASESGNSEQAEIIAQELVSALIKKGVKPQRLFVRSVGKLAPQRGSKSPRVELVKY